VRFWGAWVGVDLYEFGAGRDGLGGRSLEEKKRNKALETKGVIPSFLRVQKVSPFRSLNREQPKRGNGFSK